MRPLRASGIITEFGINGSPKNPQSKWELLSFSPVTLLTIDCFSIENLVGLKQKLRKLIIRTNKDKLILKGVEYDFCI